MPPELMELYNLYQMEIETRESNEQDQNLLVEAEKILRVSEIYLFCLTVAYRDMFRSMTAANLLQQYPFLT